MHTYKIFRTDLQKQYNKAFSDYVLETMYPGVLKAEDFVGEDEDE